MSVIDIVILIIFIPFIIRGIKLGFVVQAAAVVALIVGVWLAFRFSSLLGGWLAPLVKASPKALQTIAFVLILIAAILVFHLIGKGLEKVVHLALLGWLDKLLGGIFAAIKVILILGILIMLFNTLNTKYNWVDAATLGESFLYEPLKDAAYAVFPYFKELLA
ncbi:MAG: CvpA family protein [Bacteroidales bacterium]|nr:CvpA family protein [Bacteroidales bacterium]